MTRYLRAPIAAAITLLTLAAAPWAIAGQGRPAGELATHYELLIGKPEAGSEAAQEPTIVVTPGTVLLGEPELLISGGDLGVLKAKLAETYRLAAVYSVAAARMVLEPGDGKPMPTPFDELGVRLTLLAADAHLATYTVRLEEDGALLAEPTVAVKVGGRAVVATRDGDRAPYAFVVIAPRVLPPTPKGEPKPEPRLLDSVRPLYPEAARKGGIQGTVELECTIDKDGRVTRIDVLQAQPEGLTEAAIDAVRQWRYDPLRDEQGRPVATTTVVAITFRLD